MTISAKIIQDSLSAAGARITTFVLEYPRFIHSEFMTHRQFSRNAASSRAIPFQKMVDSVLQNPAMPIEFRKNKKGMQAGEAVADQNKCVRVWKSAMKDAIDNAYVLHDVGVHKQYVNRLLEPFSNITVVCTATDYANFFALRCHEDAQPEIKELADKMLEAYNSSVPSLLTPGGWHLPFVTEKEKLKHFESFGGLAHLESDEVFNTAWLPLIKRSVARCARVSYNKHDGTETSPDEDNALFDRLLGETPKHCSPAEHQACALYDKDAKSGNFRGFLQFRKTLPDENIEFFDGIKK